MYPKTLTKLIEEFKKLPGVGNKTAERYALFVLDLSTESVESFSNQLKSTKQSIKHCKSCGNYTEEDLCDISRDPKREQSIICVVSNPKDILAIEKTGQYTGLYHVLGGLISPINGVMPEDLTIEELIERTKKDVTEVVLALNPTMEGETTSYYIAKKLQDIVEVSVLAQGLPMGGHLEYVDEMTLTRSLKNRKKFDY